MDYDEMEAFERDAEDRFDNFYEEDDYDQEEEYEIIEVEDDYYPMEYEEEYDNYAGNGSGVLDPNDTTYTFVINNTTTDDHEVVLFGANEAIPAPSGVTIDVAESSHNEVREESKANPFTIMGMKMSVSNTAQFDNILTLVEKTSGGRLTTYVKQPRNYQSPQNQDKNLIHAVDFTIKVTGKSSIRFIAKPGKTSFTFSVQFRTNIGNVLSGKNVGEINHTPQPTGLPQLDLKRSEQNVSAQGRAQKVVRQVASKRPVRSIVRKVVKGEQPVRGAIKRFGRSVSDKTASRFGKRFKRR
jgi:hypothetical protein